MDGDPEMPGLGHVEDPGRPERDPVHPARLPQAFIGDPVMRACRDGPTENLGGGGSPEVPRAGTRP